MSDAINGHAANDAAFRDTTASAESAEPSDNVKSREPGWAWSNKQAQEEYARAYETAVDKDFPEKLQEFGDVLADE